jgi:hypothetical protein
LNSSSVISFSLRRAARRASGSPCVTSFRHFSIVIETAAIRVTKFGDLGGIDSLRRHQPGFCRVELLLGDQLLLEEGSEASNLNLGSHEQCLAQGGLAARVYVPVWDQAVTTLAKRQPLR